MVVVDLSVRRVSSVILQTNYVIIVLRVFKNCCACNHYAESLLSETNDIIFLAFVLFFERLYLQECHELTILVTLFHLSAHF